MSTATLDQSGTGLSFQGNVFTSIPLPRPEVDFSLHVNAPGISYRLEAPVVGEPVVEDNSIKVRFIVDDDVYLGLNLMGESLEQEDEFKVGRFFLYYQIEDQHPRAHFVANTLMALAGLAGKFDLKISEPEVSTNLNIESSLLEISKMLHRRQTAYRLMIIEAVTGTRFLLPSALPQKEIDKIAFVYHAIVDRSLIWPGGKLNMSVPATPENALHIPQVAQLSTWPLPPQPLSETVLGQPVELGLAVVTMEDAVVTNLDSVIKELRVGDGHQVTLEIQSRQDRYEFTETPYSATVSWEPKIQALIDLEPYLDAAITARYHALAASTLEGLTEEEKVAITNRPELEDQAFEREY